jgi:gamma-glutamyltranspeptidase/glutathione hydrolase
MARSAAALGSALSESDISGYRLVERAPLKVSWEGYDIYTMPPPSAGGMLLAQTLLMYSRAELRRLGRASGAYQHVLAEAFRGAIADRMRYLGDPDVQPVSMDKLLAPARLAARKASIALDRTHALARFGLEGGGTHFIVTADAEGNAVALTTTVNRAFGAKIAAAESGVVLNDELDDFTRKKDIELFGIPESPNRTRPGARPVSSMTPTIVVRDGRAVLALGGSGGTAIGTNVTQMLLARLAFDESPRDALASRRFYVPTNGATVLLEPGYDKELARDLTWRGEIVDTQRVNNSAVHMIAIENGRKAAAADPRKHGAALVR